MTFTRLLLLMILILALSFTVQASEGEYTFWYVSLNDITMRIEIFNPATESTENFHNVALLGYKTLISHAVLSPNHEWLAYTRGDGRYRYDVYILNLQTRTH